MLHLQVANRNYTPVLPTGQVCSNCANIPRSYMQGAPQKHVFCKAFFGRRNNKTFTIQEKHKLGKRRI